jgi:hypothetical protein
MKAGSLSITYHFGYPPFMGLDTYTWPKRLEFNR